MVDVSKHQNEFENVDVSKQNVTSQTILISCDSNNETRCEKLKQRLEKLFNVTMDNMEGLFFIFTNLIDHFLFLILKDLPKQNHFEESLEYLRIFPLKNLT
jgi:hypothetical protein